MECENQSWDDPPLMNATSNSNKKVMCSYGGKIQPRSHDNQLAYVGGDTKILAVDHNIKFSAIMAKLSSLHGGDCEVYFKYRLPGENLDALISVTNDEDLEHMMVEYGRTHRVSAKPARLRLFLFPLNPPLVAPGFEGSELKSERQWFVDALNSGQIQNLDATLPPAAAVPVTNLDFLFGLDKVKVPDFLPPPVAAAPQEVVVTVGSDCGFGGPTCNCGPDDVSSGDPETDPGVTEDAYCCNSRTRHFAEKTAAMGNQQVYLIPASAAGVYQQPPKIRQVIIPAGQPYYGVPHVVQDVYREQPVYNAVPASKVGAYAEGIPVTQSKGGVPDSGYVQVAYDGAGRQVYYTAPPYQVVPLMTLVGGVPALNQDGKVALKSKVLPPTSSL
ncbi:putative Oxidoreductase, zinc-binding dehydrogenase family protein [Hibiscus syriacus]|uniref:Oxidoreductase, zinc-binding dehydrogenase family protein n=1 Tax=Hibiscus syriacus TaxID=106335 RepID=A0A6A3BGQ3_HIBSY|nr:putative Oxidoreductase, zinc-binding dehydrogenase family protein [Hibiscus syriacus]